MQLDNDIVNRDDYSSLSNTNTTPTTVMHNTPIATYCILVNHSTERQYT